MRGNLGEAPSKVLDEQGLESGGRRWRFIKLGDRLRSTSARPTALPSADYSLNLDGVSAEDTTFSHFSTTLNTQSESDKTATFASYAAAVRPLALSLPLIFRNRKRLIEKSSEALRESTLHAGEATESIARCICALCQDIGPDNFYVLLPSVVVAFADVLETSSPGEAKSGDDNQSVSPFWDPQVTLVPIFAAVAELTKALLQPLAANPEATLECLTPLLAHSHHRVREMTAEASLGYLIRKTRDAAVRNRFIMLLVEGMPAEGMPEKIRDYLNDGLGVCLYESIRLPSGQLHSRAIDVLKTAVSNLQGSHNSSKESNENQESGDNTVDSSKKSLKITARCFASLCRYLTNGFDVQKVTLVLAMEGERAVQQADLTQLGNMLFLLRNWFGYGGVKFYSLLGEATCQRFLNFISGTVQRFKSHPGVVSEATAALCSMYKHASESFRQRSVWTAIFSCLDSLSTSSDIETMAVSLRILLESPGFLWQKIDLRPLVHRIARICDRMTAVSLNNLDGASSATLCGPALWTTLTFFRLVTGSSVRLPRVVYNYAVPSLVTETKTVLGTFIANRKAEGSNKETPGQVRDVFRLWSVVNVPECADMLSELLHLSSWDLEDQAHIINAVVRQASGKESDCPALLDKAKHLLRSTLSSDLSALDSPELCNAAERLLKSSADVEVFFSSENASESISIDQIKTKLAENISSRHAELRKASVSLLQAVYSSHKIITGANENDGVISSDLEAVLNKLRISLKSDKMSVPALLQIFSRTFKVSRSLEDISSTLRILQEMNKLLQMLPAIPEDVHMLLYHFTMGIYQTPLQPLWKHAGELWVSLAAHDCKFTMTNTLKHLTQAESALQRRIEEIDEPVPEDPADTTLKLSTEDDDDQHDGVKAQSVPADTQETAHKQEPRTPSQKTGKRPRQDSGSERSAKRQRPNVKPKGPPIWDPTPLTRKFSLSTLSQSEPSSSSSRNNNNIEGTTDLTTFLLEVFNALSKEPKHTLNYRVDIIDLYLRLEPNRFSKRKANLVIASLSSLLEKMGGLKCCGNDAELEKKVRARLLSDLSRPAAQQLQYAALKCLCASRSTPLKPVRDSLLRLVKDSSYREELTLLTDRQFSEKSDSPEEELSEEQIMVAEVMIRICLSKMKGSHGNLESRKAAALTFITSKLPTTFAMTRITDLLLEGVGDSLLTMEKDNFENPTREKSLPHIAVLRAVVGSMETVVKHCKRALPPDSWRKITIAGLFALQNARSGSYGQNIRSRALKLLASMHHIRSEETLFILPHVLKCVKSLVVDFLEADAIVGTPALLTFVEEVCQGEGLTNCLQHFWPVSFCSKVLGAENADPKALCHALVVGKRLCAYPRDKLSDDSVDDDSIEKLLQELNSSLCKLVPKLVRRMENSKQNQKVWGTPFEQSLEVMEVSMAMASFDGKEASEVVKSLCSFLQKPRLSSVSPASCLKTLTALFNGIGDDDVELDGESPVEVKHKLIYDMIPMISTRRFVKDNPSYQALCDLLLAVGPPDLKSAMDLVKGMNAMHTARLGTPDLDKRLDSINSIVKSVKEGLEKPDGMEDDKMKPIFLPSVSDTNDSVEVTSPTVLLAFCHGCVGAIHSEDTAVRGIAGFCLKQLSRWAGLSSLPCALSALPDLLSLLLQGTVTAKRIVIRREFCLALGEMARCCNKMPSNNDDTNLLFIPLLQDLVCKDPEADFFENLVHLQAHRRSRALRQLEKYISKQDDSASSDDDRKTVDRLAAMASSFVHPLGSNIALEKPDRDDLQRLRRSHKYSGAREDIAKDVSQWAVSVVAAACKLLNWDEYTSAINSLVRKLEQHNDVEDDQVAYKLLVKITESFPQPSEKRYPTSDVVSAYLIDSLLPRMLKHISSGAIENDLLHRSEKISNTLTGRRKEVQFRAPVALAIAKLLNYVSDDRQGTLVPLLITPLITSLRSKTITVREASKKALVSVILALGKRYMSQILRQVFLSLKDGFRKDMIIFFIHALVLAVQEQRKRQVDSEESLPLDLCVDELVTHIIEELRSGVSEARREYEDPNTTDARMKAAIVRTSRAYDCTELLGELVDFKTAGVGLALPLLTLQSKSTSPKLIGRAGEATRRLLLGLSHNTSVEAEASFSLCHRLMSTEDITITHGSLQKTIVIGEDFAQVKRQLAMRFAIRFLHTVVSKNLELINTHNKHGSFLRAFCQPFLPQVVEATRQRDDELTTYALRTAQKLILLRLEKKIEFVEQLCDAISEILSESASRISHRTDLGGNQELFNTCLRAAAVLYKEGTDKNGSTLISNDKVEVFMSIAKNCLENGGGETLSASLALIRSVVVARVIHPSVYDILEDVRKFAVVTQSTSLRSTCAMLITKFLITFPMRPKLMKQYLEFFVRNLNYERPSGRLSAIESIRELMSKLRVHQMEKDSQYVLIALAACLSRETDPQCRDGAFATVRVLFAKLDQSRGGNYVEELLKICATLVGVQLSMTSLQEEPMLVTTEGAAIVQSGAVCLTAACKSGQLTATQLGLVMRVCTAALCSPEEDAAQTEEGRNQANAWKTKHALLECAEAALEAQRTDAPLAARLELLPCVADLWRDAMPALLLHRHQWVRLLAANLVGRHLSAAGGRKASALDLEAVWSVWQAPGLPRELLGASCLQLEADHLSAELAQQSLKNILCVTDVVRRHAHLGDLSEQDGTGELDGGNDEGDVDNEGDATMDTADGSDDDVAKVDGDGEGKGAGGSVNRGLRWVLARMNGIATKAGNEERDILRRGCALRFFLVTTKWWGGETVQEHLALYVGPVMKVLESGDISTDVVVAESSNGPRRGRRRSSRGSTASHKGSSGGGAGASVPASDEAEEALGKQALRTICETLQAALIDAVGAEAYYSQYRVLQAKRSEMKLEKKRREALLAAIDPERNAKRRRKRAEAKKAKRQRLRGSVKKRRNELGRSAQKESLTSDL